MAFCLFAASPATTEELPPTLEKIRLEALEPVAGNAVFRLRDGKLVVVEKGKPLAETGAMLAEVLRDRVVLVVAEESRHLAIWMYPAEEPGKPGRVRIVQWQPPDLPVAPRPAGLEKPVETQPRPPRP